MFRVGCGSAFYVRPCAHHTKIMKTLFALVGLAVSCLSSGCAHDAKSNTASKPAAIATTVVTFTNTYTGTARLNYQWLDGSLPATNNTVTNAGNWYLAITDNTSVPTVTNLQGATFSMVTNTRTASLNGRWYLYLYDTNSVVVTNSDGTLSTNYSMLILKPSPGTNYCLQIIKPNEGTNYALQIIHE
jgi:hypothetical protein